MLCRHIILILLFTYLPVCICFASFLLKAQTVVVVSILFFQGGCLFSVAAAYWFICSHNFGESFNVLLFVCQLIFH
jgi:hypothetical protein